MKEGLEDKIKGVLGLYNFYKQEMNTMKRMALLTLWIEKCIDKEEYEVAVALQRELDKITSGDEEFYVISPHEIITIQQEEIENALIKIKEKKHLKFINKWGSNTFDVFRLSFKNFKFIILNFGIEYS